MARKKTETRLITPIIREAYTAYQKKHKTLPDYDSLNKHFEISSLPADEFLLRNIKRRIASTMEPVLDLLEHMLSPDPHNFTDIYESGCFTQDDKKELFTLYRHFMEQYRAILETNILGDDKEDVKLIKRIHDRWTADKNQLVHYIGKLRAFWHKKTETKQILEYLG